MFMKEENGLYYNSIFLISDIVMMELALFLSFFIRRQMVSVLFIDSYIFFGLNIIFLSIIVAFFSENYKGVYGRGYYFEFIEVLKFVTFVFFLQILKIFLLKSSNDFSRTVMFMWYFLSILFVYPSRLFLKKKEFLFSHNIRKKVLFVITDEMHLDMTFDYIKYKIPKDYFVAKIGVIGTISKKLKESSSYVLSREAVLDYALSEVVDEVLFTHVNDTEEVELMAEELVTMGITVHFDVYRVNRNISYLLSNRIGDLNVLTSCSGFVSEKNLFLKRVLDIIGASVGLCLSFPVFLVVAPLIYSSSPGPIFFKQKRVGKNGRIFTLYKFRSMYMDAEERKKELMKHNEMNGLMFKMENDPRITPIGKFIRKTSIDELPQFWNVLIGDMSLVGTRPPTVDEYEHYERHHKARLAMKPGITGMWQVSGRSDITDFEEVVSLDIEYIDNWNIGKDIKLLLKTVKVVFASQGAR